MHEVYAVLGVGSEVRKLTSKNQLLHIQEEHTCMICRCSMSTLYKSRYITRLMHKVHNDFLQSCKT
jgi:hypothetical protein